MARSSSARVQRRVVGPTLENEAERALFAGFEPATSCGVVRCISHGFPTILNRWHYHPEYELHLIVATHGRVHVGDYSGTYRPGHLVLTGPGLPHNWVVDDVPPEGLDDHFHKVIQFPDETLRNVAKVLNSIEDLFPLLERAKLGIEFFGLSGLAEKRFAEISAATGFKRLLHLLIYLSELAESKDFHLLSHAPVHGVASAHTQLESDMIEFVAANALNDLSLNDAATKFGMSGKYFSKYFKRSTGNSFTDFIFRLRINKACQLLSDTEKNISAICTAVGFNNLANFNRHFKKLKGMTPSDFRRQSGYNLGG